MTKKQFKESIRRGLGSAIIELKRTDDISQYKDIVLWACLNNTCFNVIFEGHRGWHLYQALSKFDDNEFFLDQIINKYNINSKDQNSTNQLNDLIFQFAHYGNDRAKKELYNIYDKLIDYFNKHNCQEDNPQISYLENVCLNIVYLDGFRSFKKIIKDLKLSFDNDSGKKVHQFDWFMSVALDQFGEDKVFEYFKKIEYNNYAKRNYDIEESEAQTISIQELLLAPKQPRYTYDFRYARKFANTAEPQEIEKFAKLLIEEENLDTKADMLVVFEYIPFPLSEEYLIEYSKNLNDELRYKAFNALEIIKSEKVHNYAISLFNANIEVSSAITIICNNYHKDDEILIEKYLKTINCFQAKDKNWHSAFLAIEDLIKDNKNVSKNLLKLIYEKTSCSYCRERIVEKMEKYKLLNSKILEECCWDSNSDISSWAYKKIKKTKTEKYLINLIYDNIHHYCIWYTDDEDGLTKDGVIIKKNKIIFFSTEQECQNYALLKKWNLLDEVAIYDFDEVIAEDFKCSKVLNLWNICDDCANSLYIDFIGIKQTYDGLYDKLFMGCNILTIPDNFDIIFTKDEIDIINNIIINGLSIIKENIIEVINEETNR